MSSPEAEETYRTVASLTRSSPADGELQQHHEQHSPIGAVEQKLVWDPAAHANRLAELAELAAVAGVDEPEPYVAPVRAQAPRRDPVYGDPASGLDDTMHHTMLPRLMVIAALLAGLGGPVMGFVLQRQGHLVIDGRSWLLDEHGRSVVVAALVAIGVCSVLGWLWWTVAAALNARKRARYGVSPWFAPTALLLMAAGIVGVGAVTRGRNMFSREETGRFLLAIGLGVVPIVAYFATLSAYRKTARAIGASTQGWTVVIVVPWAILAVNVLSQFFVNAIGESFIQVLGLVNMAVMGVQVLALYLALSSFDRACIGRHMGRDESNDLPDFLRPYA